MAANTTSLSARIRALEAAQKRAAALPRKARLSFVPMMELIGVSRPVLRDWCREIEGFAESGAFVMGGNGIEWDFDPRKTVAFLLKHFRGVVADQGKRSRSIAQASGIELAEDDEAVSLAEVKERMNLTMTAVAAAERQGRYMLVDEVASFIAGYNQRVIDGIMGVRTQADPNGHLPVEVRKSVDGYLRSVATQVHGLAQAFVEEHGIAGLQQEGVGRAG